ncbi:hypothetical protein GCM10009682_17790 [Luedemannella flava]|uniref:Uncharacterized protein n=1 Tax=Luedemannella flava TaxID=349316 RepID=A0ABP4XXD2_9ACTN
MRHLLSLLLAVVLTPVVFLASGYGSMKFAEAVATDRVVPTLLALAAIVVAAVAYGILILARLSPVGTVLSGLLLLGVIGWAMVDEVSYVETVPNNLFGQRGLFTAPVNAMTGILGLVLLFTIASPRRWRRYANPAAAVAGPVSAAPTYPTPDSSAPTYSPAYTPTLYSPYPPVSPTSSGGLGDADTKVDDAAGDENTVANPKPTFPSTSPYGSPPVPTQSSSPENWPRPLN